MSADAVYFGGCAKTSGGRWKLDRAAPDGAEPFDDLAAMKKRFRNKSEKSPREARTNKISSS